MNRESRRIHLSKTKPSWEAQGGPEVAAGKLEVMEKFFTPLPHSAVRRSAKDGGKQRSSWSGMRNPYDVESISSSSPSSSSSQWSSESNFGGQAGFSGYHSRTPHSRSCNDLSVGRGRKNESERRDLHVKHSGTLDLKQMEREKCSTEIHRVGSVKLKERSGSAKNLGPVDNSGKQDKNSLKNVGRRARSMEALAAKEMRKKPGKGKSNVVEQKQRFSRFLDEITIQVLSPSNLNSLGVKEEQTAGSRDSWKNSSTDSSGSRGKRNQHIAVDERQDQRRKGKGKPETSTRPKVGVDAPRPRRSRELSTSPDSASSSAWNRGRMESAPGLPSTATNSHPRKSKVQGRDLKGGSRFEPMGREPKEDRISDGSLLRGQASYVDKTPNRLSNELTAQVPIIPPSNWWSDTGENLVTLPLENKDNETCRRTKESFPGPESICQPKENNFLRSTQNEDLDNDKESLNQKITELLDHLVRAQSTICALEKLNVSSLIRHLSPEMLESTKTSNVNPNVNSQPEGVHVPSTSTGICAGIECQDTGGSDLKDDTEESTGPRPTAFTQWNPKRQRSFPALHTFYTSTESEGSLEDVLPACKLLCPRFPNLGESFSDERKDGGSLDCAETRAEQRISLSSRSSLPFPNLLPTHRLPVHKHQTRPSSSESSGDDLQLSWSHMRTQELNLDYQAAQKILDTLLGVTSSAEIFPTTQLKNIDGVSISDLPPIGYPPRSDLQFSKSANLPRTDSNHVTHSVLNKETVNSSERCPHNGSLDSMLGSKDNSVPRFHPNDYAIPPLPTKRSPLPSPRNIFPNPSTEEKASVRSVGLQEGSTRQKSENLHSSGSAYTHVTGHSSDNVNDHAIPFGLKSPSGSRTITGDWENHNVSQTHKQERGSERKPKKERSVHFQALNSEGQPTEGQVRSKFKVENQELADNASLDSTLL
ncbi:LOW QUALITY PROTEIN: uncharacterized protein RCH25_000075 [Pelodytes ibericus]